MSRKGTEPAARPMGMPCRKYNRTRRRKLRLSCSGRSEKPVEAASDEAWVVGEGTSWSSEKDERPIRLAVWAAGLSAISMEAWRRRASRRVDEFMLPLPLPLPLPSVLRCFGEFVLAMLPLEDAEWMVCLACGFGDRLLLFRDIEW